MGACWMAPCLQSPQSDPFSQSPAIPALCLSLACACSLFIAQGQFGCACAWLNCLMLPLSLVLSPPSCMSFSFLCVCVGALSRILSELDRDDVKLKIAEAREEAGGDVGEILMKVNTHIGVIHLQPYDTDECSSLPLSTMTKLHPCCTVTINVACYPVCLASCSYRCTA